MAKKTAKKSTPAKVAGKTPKKSIARKAVEAVKKAVKSVSPKKKDKIAEVVNTAKAVVESRPQEKRTTQKYSEGTSAEPEN